MRALLQAVQVLGSVLSTKMTGAPNKQMRWLLIFLFVMVVLGFVMQGEGMQR